jgi:hypothetical protein
MSELDFDELDKAVNTLMSDVPKTEPSKTDDVKTLNINSTLSDATRPSFEQLDASLSAVNGDSARPVTQKPALSTPPPSLATRRSGRFMDVVHPSSNMKTSPRPFTATLRQGVAIQPDEKLLTAMSADQSDVVNVLDTVQPVAVNEAAQSIVPESVVTQTDNSNNDWPDPLDMTSDETDSTPDVVTAPNAEEPASEVVSSDEVDDDDLFTIDELNDQDLQPLNSPFIADAKVEKRPLGGAPVEEVDEELGRAPVLGVLATDTSAATDPNDQLPASPVISEAQLPPELQSDLMAIETDGGTTAVSNEKTDANEVVAQQPEVEMAPVAPAVAPEAKAAMVPVTSTGPTSIPQQYQEEKSTSDESNGSIYDTDSYHQPLAHPAKAKSGWLWVVWILLLLIVGGGGAAALYFFGII